MTAPAVNFSLTHLSHNSISSLCLTFRYGRSDQTSVLFIDEVSMVTSILLSMINKRLQEILNCNDIFGGISVILLGDFQQMDPITGYAMHTSCVTHLVLEEHADRYGLGTPWEDGLNLFIKFLLILLNEQMRASLDIVHIDTMTQLRNTEIERPVTHQIVELLYSMFLTPQDVADRPEWNFAPVAVCGNAERCLINLQQAVRFANHFIIKKSFNGVVNLLE